ncbi:CBS domain-containing protein [Nonomuraea gerenzanensis]|uniref:Inosine-5'-monophosphate dehydrogenase n=1 Tax=Nonomuraea gerenzanensis TaxID=93944 RepID=A0A1M4EB81_9ACTN|nr:CBS domain-containing protein [Nonomuraea gerenzanensis]UBU18234.1 CBS domain-containing protein [Nonomuraea gerenzanensis]SBO96050.1 Inosine-5'-monophosphate dehydrogenase [Nonomuraea gerenzanensis]
MRMTVADVMTDKVVSVAAATPFKEIAETLVAVGISAVPVLDDDDHVLGMVSEADLLRKEEFREQFHREGYQPPLRARLRHPKARRKADGDTAAELMTSPAVRVSPEASAVEAARLMDAHNVRRLAVVDYNGRIVGIVSRRDLVKLFLRSDEELASEVRDDILRRTLWVPADGVRVEARQGVVTLSGWMERRSEAAIAARMTRRVNGVVDVVNKLSWKKDDVTARDDDLRRST